MFSALFQYRGFILGSVRREFEARYRNSLFGVFWSLITPLATIVIYVVIFSSLMKARLDGVSSEFAYGIYICAGVLTWGLFTEIINRSQNVFLENANMLKKLSFPRICLPVIVVSSSFLNFLIVLLVFLLFLAVSGSFPGPELIALIPLLMLQVFLATGLGVALGVVNVFFRDVAPFTGILLQLWFWFTPIVYPITILPAWVRELVMLNPMTSVVAGYHNIFVYGRWPDWGALITPVVITLLICLGSALLYSKRAGEMVDEL